MNDLPSDWLSKLPGAQVLGGVYLEHFDECAAGMQAALVGSPTVHAHFAGLSAEQLHAAQLDTRRRVERAFGGDWNGYAEHLKRDGERYASLGFSFADWFSLAAAWTTPLLPLLVQHLLERPGLLTEALTALLAYRDRALLTIGEAFLIASQRETKAREGELHVTFGSIADAVITTDASGRVGRANRLACELLKEESLVGRPLAEVWHPRREPAGLEPEDLRLTRSDGSSISVSKSRAAILGPDDVKRGEIIVFRDVTESRRRALELKRWEALFEGVGWGICITDATGSTLAQCNAAFLRMYGFERHDPTRTLESLFDADDQLRVWREVGPGASQSGVASYEAIHRRADGTTFPVQAEAVRIPDVDHQPAWVISIHDLTEHRQLEALKSRARDLEAENRHVQESSRLKSEFLANMSHELRTPLNSILGFSELLHHGEVGPLSEQQQEFLGDIHASGKHLLRLINDVLDLSKVEAGKLEFYPEDVDLVALAEEVVGVLRGVAHRKAITIDVSVDPAVTSAFIDPVRLKQVFYNYLSNALKFTPTSGVVHLRLTLTDDAALRIEVEDHGPGIAPANLSRLFTEFDQLDAGRTKSNGGTGLGLALTRRMVEAQGGRVGVDSVEGQGCRFFAVVPLRSTTGSPLPLPIRSMGPRDDAPRILVIEDDPADQACIATLLVSAGYAVDTAATASHALEAMRRNVYAGVTLDLVLPDGDGLTLLRALRALEGYTKVPVIVISMAASQVTAAFAVQEALQKPLRKEEFFAALARMDVVPPGPVLIVDHDDASARLLGTSLASLGIELVVARNGLEGLGRVAERTPSAIVLELVMPVLDGLGFLYELRRRPEWAHIPVLVWTSQDVTADERAELLRSTSGVLSKDGAGGSALLEAFATYLPRVLPPGQ